MGALPDEDENLGEMGSTTAFQYWNDWVNVAGPLWEDQLARWARMYNAAASRGSHPGEWTRDVADLWNGWISSFATLATFPWEWSVRRPMSIPSVMFMVDGAAEATGPQSVPSPIAAAGLQIAATDLHRVGGGPAVPSEHVFVELTSNGNRVQVTLVNLGKYATTSGNALANGLYTGAVYAFEGPSRRPLAFVHLHVERSGAPGASEPPPER
jgi:hypothetical protein